MASVSNIIIAAMIVSFVFQFVIPGHQEALIFNADLAPFEPWRLFTASLFHINILHLFANAYALFIIGNALESKAEGNTGKAVEGRMKKWDLAKLLFAACALGYFWQFIGYSYGFSIFKIGLGASTGISALLAAAALLVPEKAVKVFFIPIKLRNLAILFFAFEIVAFALGNLTTDHESHLLGGIIGVAYVKLLENKEKSRKIKN